MSIRNIIRNVNISEASLGRLYQHIGKDAILMISANRSELEQSENKSNTNALKRYIKAANFGYNRVKGGYKEKMEDGSMVEVEEDSFIVYADKDKEKTLYKLGLALGKKFNQDSILFVSSEGKAQFISTRQDSSLGPIGTKQNLGDFSFNSISQYYTKIGKKSFTIRTITEEEEFSRNFNAQAIGDGFQKIIDTSDTPIEDWESTLVAPDENDEVEDIENFISNIENNQIEVSLGFLKEMVGDLSFIMFPIDTFSTYAVESNERIEKVSDYFDNLGLTQINFKVLYQDLSGENVYSRYLVLLPKDEEFLTILSSVQSFVKSFNQDLILSRFNGVANFIFNDETSTLKAIDNFDILLLPEYFKSIGRYNFTVVI